MRQHYRHHVLQNEKKTGYYPDLFTNVMYSTQPRNHPRYAGHAVL